MFFVSIIIIFFSVGCIDKKLTDFSAVDSQNFYEKNTSEYDSKQLKIYESKDKIQIKYFSSQIKTPSAAKEIILKNSRSIKLLYLSRANPYGAIFSTPINCYDEASFNSSIDDSIAGLELVLYVQTGLGQIIGSCPVEATNVFTQIVFLYCKKTNTLFEIQVFSSDKFVLPNLPKKSFFKCNDA